MSTVPNERGSDSLPLGSDVSFPTLADHACHLFYSVTWKTEGKVQLPHLVIDEKAELPSDLGLTVSHLVATAAVEKSWTMPPNWLLRDIREIIAEQRPEKMIWEPEALAVGSDLHLHLHRILGAKEARTDDRYAQAFRISDVARKLLGGGRLSRPKDPHDAARGPRRLTVKLGQAARRRLAARFGEEPKTQLELHIRDARYIFFRTGQALLLVEVSFGLADGTALHPYWVVEGLSAVA